MNGPDTASTKASSQERLIASTAELLWERGFVGTSPQAIQKHAGVGQGSMYHHFGGKAELAVAALELSADGLKASATAALAGSGSSLDRLRSYLARDRDVLRGCRIGRMAQDPDVVDDDMLREPVAVTLAWLVETLSSVIADGQRAGEINPALDAAQVATTIAATLQGGYVLARAAQNRVPFDQAVGGVLALLGLAQIHERGD